MNSPLTREPHQTGQVSFGLCSMTELQTGFGHGDGGSRQLGHICNPKIPHSVLCLWMFLSLCLPLPLTLFFSMGFCL